MSYFGQKYYNLEIARGNVPGMSFTRRFGKIQTIQAATPADVWVYGVTSGAETYTWSSSADIDSISSSSASDTQQITIVGLDTNYAATTQTATLNGQTRVALTTSLIRVNNVYNNSATDLVGNVYVYPNTAITAGVPDDVTKVRAYVAAADNQSLQTMYTVPAGYTAYITGVEVSLINRKTAIAEMIVKTREYGSVFLNRLAVNLANTGSSGRVKNFQIPIKFTEKTDFIATGTVDTNDTGLTYVTEWLLVEN